jgi:uncharacterized HAD superfamily protein
MIGDKSQWQTPSFEFTVSQVQSRIIAGYLSSRKNVIVDNCHCNKSDINDIRKIIQQYVDGTGNPVELKLVVFDTPHHVCVDRDLARDRTVGEDVILSFSNSLKKGVEDGWIKNSIEIITPTQKTLIDNKLPLAIIVDIDGTLAELNGRNPYATELCLNDSLNETVAQTVHMYKSIGYAVIIVSGRSDKFKILTQKWLDQHQIEYDELFMREDGDMTKDSTVKKNIYQNNISIRYSVELVLDDRQQVVNMWRDIGLTCYQVAFGDF